MPRFPWTVPNKSQTDRESRRSFVRTPNRNPLPAAVRKSLRSARGQEAIGGPLNNIIVVFYHLY